MPCRVVDLNWGLRLLNYKTNPQQLPRPTGSGYMNTENYDCLEEQDQIVPHVHTLKSIASH